MAELTILDLSVYWQSLYTIKTLMAGNSSVLIVGQPSKGGGGGRADRP